MCHRSLQWRPKGRGGRGTLGVSKRSFKHAEKGFVPSAVAADGLDFMLDGAEAVEKQLANVGKDGDVARGDAFVGKKREELAEDVVDVIGGLELAGKGGELGADISGLDFVAFEAGVMEAESGMGWATQHAAPMAAGVGEEAAAGIGGIGGIFS